jgi:hypothetical protein
MGILDEGREMMEEYKGALDAGLRAATQAVEHYEIFPIRQWRPTPMSTPVHRNVVGPITPVEEGLFTKIPYSSPCDPLGRKDSG